jgi:hypothetical protein
VPARMWRAVRAPRALPGGACRAERHYLAELPDQTALNFLLQGGIDVIRVMELGL